MKRQKIKQKKNKKHSKKYNYMYIDSDLPSAPKLEIYQETFGSIKNITEKWYKENGE